MDKETKLAHELFIQGFNYGIQYCLKKQEISKGIVFLTYPDCNDLENIANSCYLDILLREQDKKEKEEVKKDLKKMFSKDQNKKEKILIITKNDIIMRDESPTLTGLGSVVMKKELEKKERIKEVRNIGN